MVGDAPDLTRSLRVGNIPDLHVTTIDTTNQIPPESLTGAICSKRRLSTCGKSEGVWTLIFMVTRSLPSSDFERSSHLPSKVVCTAPVEKSGMQFKGVATAS